jgi:hypothetical protein
LKLQAFLAVTSVTAKNAADHDQRTSAAGQFIAPQPVLGWTPHLQVFQRISLSAMIDLSAAMPAIFADLAVFLAVAASVSLVLSVVVTGAGACFEPIRNPRRDCTAPASTVAGECRDHRSGKRLGHPRGGAGARVSRGARARGGNVAVALLVSRLGTRTLANVSLRWGNFFRSELQHADAITCYLMPRVRDMLDSGLRPGTRVVSNTFLFRGRAVSASRHRALGGTVARYIWPARHWVAG